jgi:hypothetical protein
VTRVAVSVFTTSTRCPPDPETPGGRRRLRLLGLLGDVRDAVEL